MIKPLLTLIAVSVLSLFSWAQGNESLTAESLDIRNKIESDVQKNLQTLLSTRLSQNTFTVAVRARVSIINPPKPPEKQKTSDLPAGMDLGAIDVRELITSYERELDELKIIKEAKSEKGNQYRLRSLEVVVGLSESYGEEYQKTFSTWLKNKMKSDYGSVATADVNPLKFQVDYDSEKNQATPPEKEFDIKQLFPLIAAAILGFALLLLGLFLKSGLKSVATAQKPLAVDTKGNLTQTLLPSPEENTEEKSLAASGDIERFDGNATERLVSKIAFVCLELNEKLNDLVKVWVDSGDRGFIKTALLIDTIINAREKIMSQTGNLTTMRIPIDEDLVKLREENIAEAYRQVSQMETEEKAQHLDEIYWDLISFRTLGLQSLRRPFDYLQGLSKDNLMEVLNVQNADTQALALVYLPTEMQTDILSEFDQNKKVDVIKNMLSQSQISQNQIWDVDTSVKIGLINQSANPEEKLVNLFPRTVEVIKSLNILDEIKVLRQVSAQLPDNGIILKQQYTTLAFIDEWKQEYVKKISQVATSDELLTLIRHNPNAKDLILNAVSPKTKLILEDDLKIEPLSEDMQAGAKLQALKSKWSRIVATENIPMSKVLSPQRDVEALSAA